jgi:ribosomal protein S18 acetylase RimI-like enzyme
LDADALVGFARVVTDRATYAYLTDFVVAEGARGRGIGRQMMTTMIAHPDLQGLRRFSLLTSDAMALYEEFGFERGSGSLTYMERRSNKASRSGF